MTDELPEGWATVRLADLLEPGGVFDGPFGSNLKTSDYTDSGVRVIRLENLANLAFIQDKCTYISQAKYETLTKHTVREGDILVGSFVDGAVRVCVLPKLPTTAIAKADCFCVRTRADVADRRFVAHQLGTIEARDAFVENIHGATRPRITTKQLREFVLRVAPVGEQRRIVGKVEALLGQVNRAKERLARVPRILKGFRRAVLAAACSGKLTNAGTGDGEVPSSWRWSTLGELLIPGGIFDGARDHGSRSPVALNLRTSDYTESGVRVIRLENLAHLSFVADKRTYISMEKYAGLKQNTVVEGDILLGSFIDETLRVCILPRLDTPAVAKADCFCVRPRPELVLREYLVLQLACDRTHDALLEEVHGATRPRITTKQLRAVRVPLCSLSEQAEIVRRTKELFAVADTIGRRVSAAATQAEKLPQAILSKAFAGEMVPTEAELARQEGRTYETAAELLRRIGEQSAAPSPQRRHNGTPARSGRGRERQRA